jgi:single-stranded-DNA-specific exonuclease
MTRWLDPVPVQIPASFADLGLYPLVAQTLLRRGFTTSDTARAFLDPLHSVPVPFPGIDAALEIIGAAVRSNQPICVWGDFDVDGQTATTLLVQALQARGGSVSYYIPVRGKESHGLHVESLGRLIDNGAKLIVTCDTGITAHEAVDYAASRGVEVVVTDHHDVGETLPNAAAIVNPKLLPAGHPLANLAGVGVAYKLAEVLLGSSDFSRSMSEVPTTIATSDLLDLVALGLIADVALLKGETRTLAQKGILALRGTRRLGLRMMAELSGTALETLTEDTIGFTFAPRLNALGRLGDANPAVELLMTQDAVRARVLAAQIEGLNAQRRLLTSQVYEAAEAQLHEKPDRLTEPILLLTHRDWPGGVVGIVANKLVERYHKPALLLTESEDGILRGSARSVEGLHITEAIAANRNLLLGFGGHPMAAGLSLRAVDLPAFRKGLDRAVEQQLGTVVREEPTLQVDAWLGLSEINFELAEALERLAPFGAGNPSLVLATHTVMLKKATELGKAREHVRLTVEDEAGNSQGVMWWNGAGEELPEEGSKFDIAYSLRAGTYRGKRQITLQFEEFRVVEEPPVEVQRPKLEIRDLRSNPSAFSPEPGILVWAEGTEKTRGLDRFNLFRADELAIYTAPASPLELRGALEIVKPKKVLLIVVPLPAEKTDDFLTRLAGMAKFAINQRNGKASIREFASATAQREVTVRLGLEWLAAGGHLVLEAGADELRIAAGDSIANQYLQRELYMAVKGLLEETTAYRAHFARAEARSLLEF